MWQLAVEKETEREKPEDFTEDENQEIYPYDRSVAGPKQ